MKSQAIVAYGQPLEEVTSDIPAPKGTEVLVKISHSGVCHSDEFVMSLPAEAYVYGLPLTLGHEGAGVVAAVGTGVTGICGSAIIEVVAEMFLSGIISEDGVIDGAMAARTPRILENGRSFSYLLHDGAQRAGAIVEQTMREVRAAVGLPE